MTKEEKKQEKERLKEEANLKKYGPAGFAKNFILSQLIIMYVVIWLSNIFIQTDFGVDIPRYLLVFGFGLMCAFSAIKKCFELCTKDEYINIKKLTHIYIGVIALVMLFYGLYSVSSNAKKIEERYNNLSSIFGLEGRNGS